MEIVRCEGLKKVYGTSDNQVVALEDVSFTVEKGEFVAVVGASGSGKSTLLHILGGMDYPTEGKVFVENIDLSTLNSSSAAVFRRRNIGLIYQFYNLIPTLTVKGNIIMPMVLDKKKPDKDFFDKVVTTLGLQDKLNALPSELSGGQQQRTAIARSLLYRPSLLLADEPTGNLDNKNSREVMELIKQFNKDLGQTIIIITHDEKLALEADRRITLEDGKIISDENRRR